MVGLCRTLSRASGAAELESHPPACRAALPGTLGRTDQLPARTTFTTTSLSKPLQALVCRDCTGPRSLRLDLIESAPVASPFAGRSFLASREPFLTSDTSRTMQTRNPISHPRRLMRSHEQSADLPKAPGPRLPSLPRRACSIGGRGWAHISPAHRGEFQLLQDS